MLCFLQYSYTINKFETTDERIIVAVLQALVLMFFLTYQLLGSLIILVSFVEQEVAAFHQSLI